MCLVGRPLSLPYYHTIDSHLPHELHTILLGSEEKHAAWPTEPNHEEGNSSQEF